MSDTDYSRTGLLGWVYELFPELSDEEVIEVIKKWERDYEDEKKGSR
jgi:predicted phosphoribosyltransferase